MTTSIDTVGEIPDQAYYAIYAVATLFFILAVYVHTWRKLNGEAREQEKCGVGNVL